MLFDSGRWEEPVRWLHNVLDMIHKEYTENQQLRSAERKNQPSKSAPVSAAIHNDGFFKLSWYLHEILSQQEQPKRRKDIWK